VLEPVSNNCHAYLEQLLTGSNLSSHFLRTTGFMGNALGFAQQIVQGGAVRFPYGRAARRSVREGDLAAVGVRLLLDPGAIDEQVLLISGPKVMTQAEQIAQIGAVLGRSLTWTDVEAGEACHHLVQAGWPLNTQTGRSITSTTSHAWTRSLGRGPADPGSAGQDLRELGARAPSRLQG
jgi:uncharacterized protein YbjT (DUF2867 family)